MQQKKSKQVVCRGNNPMIILMVWDAVILPKDTQVGFRENLGNPNLDKGMKGLNHNNKHLVATFH